MCRAVVGPARCSSPMEAFAESWQNARRRVPSLGDIARVVHGPEAFTPDGEFLLGETPVAGFWVAAGSACTDWPPPVGSAR